MAECFCFLSMNTSSLIQKYRNLLERIEALPNMHPSPLVNAVFSDLVAFAQQDISDKDMEAFLHDPYVMETLDRLQSHALRAETCLEFHWTERLAGLELEAMRAFPYFQNYALLIEQEIECLRMFVQEPRHILFVGAGPMPLSPLLLQAALQTQVTSMDMSWEACAHHKRVQEVHPHFQSVCSDICAVRDFREYDIIMLAALVGENEQQKLQIVDHLFSHMTPGQILLLRNSAGMKKILYPSVSCEHVQELGGNKLLLHYAPQNAVINATSLFMKV